jgi:hypothetical protein
MRVEPDVLKAAQNNPGTSYVAFCDSDGTQGAKPITGTGCVDPKLTPAKGQCVTGTSVTCGNAVAKCDKDYTGGGGNTGSCGDCTTCGTKECKLVNGVCQKAIECRSNYNPKCV